MYTSNNSDSQWNCGSNNLSNFQIPTSNPNLIQFLHLSDDNCLYIHSSGTSSRHPGSHSAAQDPSVCPRRDRRPLQYNNNSRVYSAECPLALLSCLFSRGGTWRVAAASRWENMSANGDLLQTCVRLSGSAPNTEHPSIYSYPCFLRRPRWASSCRARRIVRISGKRIVYKDLKICVSN